MNRRFRSLALAATIGVALLPTGSVRACTTLDVGCSADAVGGDDDATDEATRVAGGALGPAGDAIEGVIGTVTEGVDDVLGSGPEVPTDPVDPGGPSTQPGDRGTGGRDDHRLPSGERRARQARTEPMAPETRLDPIPPSAIGTAASGSSRIIPASDRSGGVRDAIVAALPSLAVLAALAALVVAIVAIQAAIDRRDPRLALARAADEVVRFR